MQGLTCPQLWDCRRNVHFRFSVLLIWQNASCYWTTDHTSAPAIISLMSRWTSYNRSVRGRNICTRATTFSTIGRAGKPRSRSAARASRVWSVTRRGWRMKKITRTLFYTYSNKIGSWKSTSSVALCVLRRTYWCKLQVFVNPVKTRLLNVT